MEKWANFAVTKVKYDQDGAGIVEVEVREDKGEALSTKAERLSRAEVVSAIVFGTTFVTVYQRDGKWQKGENVRIVTIRGHQFIRTDSNATSADNLGALPEYT